MIPNFYFYNILNESISLKDLKYGKKISYGSVKDDFLSRNYDFLGNITFKVNKFKCPLKYKDVLDVVPDDICDKLKKPGYKYVSSIPNKEKIYVNVWGCDDESKLLDIFPEPAVENVIPCISKKGDLYYALYNDDKKYFYFVTSIGSLYTFSDPSAVGFCELFVKVRTSSVEEVVSEIDDLKSKYEEDQRLEREKREKKEEERKIRKEKEKEYNKRVELLKADVEDNPENYEMIDGKKDLPQEIQDALNSDDYMDTKYVEYVQSLGPWDPYDQESVMVYVNDDELTKGYKYRAVVDHARPGTYWGD